jgi:superoxide dismutase, Cu-Zn family
MRRTLPITIAAFLLAAPTLTLAADVTAPVQDTDGNNVGAVRVTDTPSGAAYVVIQLAGLPEGVHGTHFHATGDCSADDFSSAGDHIAGDATHGILSGDGSHPGDLPNITISEGGTADIELFLADFDIEQWLQDDDGAAFVVHSGADDYESQPSGESGDRIACGVFEARE